MFLLCLGGGSTRASDIMCIDSCSSNRVAFIQRTAAHGDRRLRAGRQTLCKNTEVAVRCCR